jgi:uncharacterized protein YidB (DUF937 family)
MAGLDDTFRSAVPGGSIAKPLLLALGALFASGALFKGGSPAPAAGPETAPQPSTRGAAGGLLDGLGGLVDKLQKGGLSSVVNSWVGPDQNQPVSPGQIGTALGPDILKTLAQRSGISEEELTKQLSHILPGVVDKLTPNGRIPTLAELPDLK